MCIHVENDEHNAGVVYYHVSVDATCFSVALEIPFSVYTLFAAVLLIPFTLEQHIPFV